MFNVRGIDENDILPYYNERSRYYHNEKHLDFCLTIHNECTDARYNLFVSIALIFHDVIYSPLCDNNEEESVKFMRNYLLAHKSKISFPCTEGNLNYISRLIIATKNDDHSWWHDFGDSDMRYDCMYIRDIDRAILCTKPDVYDNYGKNVRKEFSFLSDYTYNMSRLSFLKETLESRIYKTEYFYREYEKKAIANIKREISNLEKIAEKSKKFDFSEN
jgi:predicted metal-dependent HD superfamily phosphohydrolase